MKKKFILALIILLSIITISCTNVVKNDCDNDIIETFENIIETFVTPSIETIPKETEKVLFDKDITFTCEYVYDKYTMPYALYAPSITTEHDSTSLIVWLHGVGEKGANEKTFLEHGLPMVLNDWSLDGFNAYILCPQLAKEWCFDSWCNLSAENSIKTLIDKIVDKYNIDKNNIIIVGHSLGGQGAIYMVHQMPDYFSKLVVLSGYDPKQNVDIKKITIPTIGFIGLLGEDYVSAKYMHRDFANTFGKENVIEINSSHTDLPYAVFNEDNNNNNKSDIIEWMLSN